MADNVSDRERSLINALCIHRCQWL